MKESATISLLFVLLASLIIPVYASLSIQASIGQNIHVVFDFRDIDSTTYNETKHQGMFNVSTIPQTIKENLEERDLGNGECIYDPTQEIFDDSTRSIRLEFVLMGLDIIHVTIDNATRNKIYSVRTDWRKFQVNLTDEYVLDFNEYFGIPLREWEFDNKTTSTRYIYNHTSSIGFDPVCHFILPTSAMNPHIAEDWETIVFELPPSLGESLLNSPFSILVAVLLVNAIAVIYRRIRE
jgi:hypothetical protein